MTTSIQELEKWFQDRPKWLQDSARRLIKNGTLVDKDYAELLSICLAESLGQSVSFSGIPSGTLVFADATKPLRLESISDVKGINALAPSKPLEFGKTSLCIVYGRNGAGKSGYVRLLKHACGSRQPGELRGNIFSAANQPKSAVLTVSENGQTKTYQWNGLLLPELNGVDIYDTACCLVYINDENEVAFEPWLLRFFTLLTNASITLSSRIQVQISGHVSKKPVLPEEYAQTSAAEWYGAINADTTKQDTDNKIDWEPEHEAELNELNKRLAETDPAAKAATLRRQKELLLELVTDLRKHVDCMSDDICKGFLIAKSDASTKRKAVDEDAVKVFAQAPLSGVGTESWRLLWDKARKYSEEHAYKSMPYPNMEDGARCVLCQRELDKESRDRFTSFEKFVKGELQQLALDAEQAFQTVAATFTEVPTVESLAVKMAAAGLEDDAIKSAVFDFAARLSNRNQTRVTATSQAEISALPSCEILTRLEALATEREILAVTCDEDAKGQNRPQLTQRAKELAAQKWLHEQRAAINDEILRLKAIYQLQQADRLTNTRALSQRKSILTEELITKTYIQRFQNELRRLNASRLAVELRKTRADVGHVYHRIALKNAAKDVETSDILSEGEFRIVSLAAFLADTEGRDAKTPFIFDDPISSLDQVYEEATAQRLVELTKSRQVIVFTHRLSLVGSLEKYAEKADVKENTVCLSWYVVGDITELPIDLKRTDKAVNALANERLAGMKKAFAEGGAVYEKEAKSLCRDMRVLTERIVEADLLVGVVKRYSPEVNTKGKIHHLAKITPEDCKFIDDMMTKYSRFEHSQSEESPVELPTPAEFEEDLKALQVFIESLKKRQKI